MALVTCPECGKEISDTAVSCPNCGYSFPTAQKVVQQIRSTQISHTKKNPFVGTIVIVVGVLGLLGGILLLPIGFISIIAGFVLIMVGASLITGRAKADCPYCGKQNNVPKNAINMTCPFCRKVSVRNGEEMKTISE